MIKFTSNIENFSEMVGTVFGVSAGVESDMFIEGLINAAHNKASEEFDLTAAASASSGYLSHMFEYGVPGVSRGPIRIPDPTDERARLWTHHITGHGGKQEISFMFRPAVIPNPQPTVAYTGVPNKYLKLLSRRKYVFRQRALVMETGMEVNIKPKNGNLLFVPFYGEGSNSNPTDKRGFMMYPFAPRGIPITTTPGRNTKGTFTAFWNKWWDTAGKETMNLDIEKNIRLDVQHALDAGAARAKHSMKPAAAQSIMAATAKAARKTKSDMNRTSTARNRKKRR